MVAVPVSIGVIMAAAIPTVDRADGGRRPRLAGRSWWFLAGLRSVFSMKGAVIGTGTVIGDTVTVGMATGVIVELS